MIVSILKSKKIIFNTLFISSLFVYFTLMGCGNENSENKFIKDTINAQNLYQEDLYKINKFNLAEFKNYFYQLMQLRENQLLRLSGSYDVEFEKKLEFFKSTRKKIIEATTKFQNELKQSEENIIQNDRFKSTKILKNVTEYKENFDEEINSIMEEFVREIEFFESEEAKKYIRIRQMEINKIFSDYKDDIDFENFEKLTQNGLANYLISLETENLLYTIKIETIIMESLTAPEYRF